MSNEQTIFEIPESNKDKFLSEIARLSRRAVKLGFAPFEPRLVGQSTQKRKDWTYRVFHYEFSASAPRINGWRFVAAIDHSAETGNIIRAIPNSGVEIPASYRHSEQVCDHCGIRRYRKNTFLLSCEGQFKSVGSQCLKDFFGHDPMAVARFAEILAYAQECGDAMGEFDFVGGQHYIYLRDFLANAAAVIRVNGWVSRAKAREEGRGDASADCALNNMYERNPDHKIAITDDDRAIVEAAIEWGLGLSDKHTLTDYEHNVTVVVGSSVINHKSIGIAASIIGVYLMHRDREAQRAATLSENPSSYVGKIDERLRNIDVVLTGAFPIESTFGSLMLYTFLYEGKNVLKWFTAPKDGLKVGDKVKLTGTVKKHEDYKGVKQTNLSRCSIKGEK